MAGLIRARSSLCTKLEGPRRCDSRNRQSIQNVVLKQLPYWLTTGISAERGNQGADLSLKLWWRVGEA